MVFKFNAAFQLNGVALAVSAIALMLGSISSHAAVAEGIATGPCSLAIGSGSSAQSSSTVECAVAHGQNARASTKSLAVGPNANAAVSSVAVGEGSNALSSSVAVGQGASAKVQQATAIGYQAKALLRDGVAIGHAAASNGGISIGSGASTSNGNAVGRASSAANLSNSFGDAATALGHYSIALGNQTTASGQFSTSAGSSALASGQYSLALGSSASASQRYSVALGAYSTTAEPTFGLPAIVLGGHQYLLAGARPQGVVSVGNVSQGLTRQITGVAAGVNPTDAVNMSQLNATNEALRAIAPGSNPSNIVVAPHAAAFDLPAVAGPTVAVDPGTRTARSPSSGQSTQVSNSSNAVVHKIGVDAIGLGSNSVAAGNRSVALGAGSVANRENEVNVGGRQVGGVSDARVDSDAVNLAQMHGGDASTSGAANRYTEAGDQHTLSQSNSYSDERSRETLREASSYTDGRAAQTLTQANSYTDARIKALKKDMAAGDAAALAAAGVSFGESGYGVATSYVNGQAAVAVGKRWAAADSGVSYQVKVVAARKTVGAVVGMSW